MRCRLILILSVVVFFGAADAFAQTREYPETKIADEDVKPIELNLWGRWIDEADVDDMSGDVQINETRAELSTEMTLDNGLPITFSLEHAHNDLDSSVPVELPSHLESTSFGVATKFPMPFVESEGFFVGAEVYPTMATDDGEWEDSAFRLPGRIYGIYKAHEDLIFVAGLTVRVDYDTPFFPILGVIYRPNDRLSFNFASANPNITYKIDDNLSVFAEFNYTTDEYEVSRGSQEGVVLKYRAASSGVGLRYILNDTVVLSLSTGAVFARKLEYEDDVGKVVPDAAAYARAEFNLVF